MNLTPTEIASSYIAGRFDSLTADERESLRNDEGLIVHVDMETGSATTATALSDDAVEVAVWHRDDDDMIVAFHDPDHPDDGEQWDERLRGLS